MDEHFQSIPRSTQKNVDRDLQVNFSFDAEERGSRTKFSTGFPPFFHVSYKLTLAHFHPWPDDIAKKARIHIMDKPAILIVEDETIIAIDIQSKLRKLKYDVIDLLTSGEEVIEFLENNKAPDLILMDIMLRGEMTGIDAAIEVKEKYQIPVIFLTAYTDSATVEKVKSAEPAGYLAKPLDDIFELRGLIEIALHKHEMNKKLHQQEQNYLQIFNATNEVIFMHDAETGDIVEINDTVEAVFGYTPDEAKKLGPNDMSSGIPPYTAEGALNYLKQAMTEGPQSFEWQSRKKSGELFWTEVSLKHARISDQDRILAVVRDITDRRAAETARQESESKFRHIVESSPMGMHLYRLESSGDLVFIGANPSADKILGVDNSLFIGKTIEEAFPALKETEIPARYKNVAESGTPWKTAQISYDENKIQGAFEVYAFQTSPNHMTAAFLDITERKRTELALQTSEERLKFALEGTNDGIWDYRPQEDIVYFSPRWFTMLGYEADAFPQKYQTWYDLVHSQDVEDAAFKLQDFIKRKETYYSSVFRMKDADGKWRWILSRGKTVERDSKKNIIRMVGTHTDITEQRQAEIALSESENRLRRMSEATFEGIGFHDKGVIVDCNKQLAEILGYTRKEMIGKSVVDFVAPSDRDVVEKNMRSGVQEDYEHAAIQKDGTIIHIETRARETIVDGKPVRMAAIRDVTDRKNAEKALRESEERFRSLVQHLSDIIWVIDQNILITYSSPSVQRVLGYSPEELLNKNGFKLIHPDDLDLAKEEISLIMTESNDHIPTQLRLQHKNGDWVYLDILAENLLKNPSVSGIVITARDVTARKNAEEALLESEERFRSVVQQSSDGISITDEKGNIIEWNKAHYEATGIKKEDVLGKPIWDVIYKTMPKQRQKGFAKAAIKAGIKIALATGKSGWLEKPKDYQTVHIDGSIKYVQLMSYSIKTSKGFQLVAVTRDITDRRMTEEALLESEEKYRHMIELANDAIVILQDGNIKFANSRVPELLGKPMTKIFNTPFLEYVAPKHKELTAEYHMKRIQGEPLPQAYEIEVIIKGGKTIPVEVNAARITYQDKPAAQVFLRDISERKQVENAMRQAQQAFHLASLGTLAAGISHEINQPLTALKVKVDGMLYWAEEKPENLQKNLLRNLEFISTEADKIDQIIRHMRSLIREEKLKTGKVDLNPVIRRATDFLRQQLNSHGINLRFELKDNLPLVLASDTPVEQIVVNLINNAMKALDSLDKEDKYIIVKTRQTEKSCLIDFEDNGPGIPEEYLSRIFDPLFTTDSDGRGMGLGLSIVEHLVKDLGGSIRVKNIPDGGSRFTIALPRADISHNGENS